MSMEILINNALNSYQIESTYSNPENNTFTNMATLRYQSLMEKKNKIQPIYYKK